MPQYIHPDNIDDGRQRKRRKTDHPAKDATFRYGRYGQVDPGRLRLYVDSCDGHVHDDRTNMYYGPENILKHDKSVYCTTKSRCNIILRHHDASPFTLEKLHILAPENGFTAPLKEGLVYVAMNRESLIPYLRNESAQRLAPPPSPPILDQDDVPLNLLESLNDEDISRTLQGRRSRSALLPPLYSIDLDPTSDDWAIPAHSEHRSAHLDVAPQQTASVECDEQGDGRSDDECPGFSLSDDEVSWPEDPTRAEVLEDRQRRERHMAYADDDDDNSGWDARFAAAAHPRLAARVRRAVLSNQAKRGKPTSPLPAPIRNDNVTQARFQIKEGKHKVAIKFNPPISGTHILLKLQTPYIGKNIDIQTVIATGFAGPRYIFTLVSLIKSRG